MLRRFDDLPLAEPYDVYQGLMSYWDDVMQDDVYLISADGWVSAAKPRGVIDDKDKKIKEVPDLTIKSNKYKMDLIPPGLIVGRYFTAEIAAIVKLTAKREMAISQLEEFMAEHSGENGLLEDLPNDQGKITKKSLNARIQDLTEGEYEENREETKVLKRCLTLVDAESKAVKAVKEAQASLDQKVLARYGTLTIAEIKTLVVEDKWLTGIRGQVQNAVASLTYRLVERTKELEERYVQTLPQLVGNVNDLSKRVEEHLKRMGLTWG